MPLIKDGVLCDDPWTAVADDAPLPEGPAIVSLARWQAQAEALRRHPHRLGLRLASDETPEAIVADLDRFALICLEFPRFQDGRAYSHARKLRQRYGYAGELRATGNVLRDQLLFMHRCGFDAVEVAGEDAAADWQRALSEISVVYQPAADARRPAMALRGGAAGGASTM